jgi:hypothetical protein
MTVTSTEFEGHRKAASAQTVEFVRLGYAGASLDFRTQVMDAGTFRDCMTVIGGYNKFSGADTADAIGRIFGELMSVDVGREGSVVLYLYVPFTKQQRIGTHEGSDPIPDREREAFAGDICRIGRELHADEIDIKEHDGRPYYVRLWWD